MRSHKKDIASSYQKAAHDMYEATISRLDGRKIVIPVNNAERDSLPIGPCRTEDLAFMLAIETIDGGGMN